MFWNTCSELQHTKLSKIIQCQNDIYFKKLQENRSPKVLFWIKCVLPLKANHHLTIIFFYSGEKRQPWTFGQKFPKPIKKDYWLSLLIALSSSKRTTNWHFSVLYAEILLLKVLSSNSANKNSKNNNEKIKISKMKSFVIIFNRPFTIIAKPTVLDFCKVCC